MKFKFFCKILLLVVLLISIFNVKCHAESDFTYELDSDNYAIITAYKGTSSDIVIPNTIDGYEVKSIKSHAFDQSRNNTNGKILKNVIISEGITSVGDFAFVGCDQLESVTLPETLTSLGDQTFLQCSKLAKINIPSNLKRLRTYVFQETAFTEFTIPEGFEYIGQCDFRICTQLKSFKVYDRDVQYADGVFEYCSNDLVLYGYEGSTTQAYAEQEGLTFKLLSDESDENENVPVASLSLNKQSLSLYVGDSETLTATILPNNSTDKTILWSSSNTNVATVENGKVTAKGTGSATITVSTKDGAKQATCIVNVSNKSANSESPKDNTIVKGSILPRAGSSSILLIILAILFIVCVISFIIYKSYQKFTKM